MISGTRHTLRPMYRNCRFKTWSIVDPDVNALYCWIHCLIIVAMRAVHRAKARLVNQRPLTQRSNVVGGGCVQVERGGSDARSADTRGKGPLYSDKFE